MASRGSHGGYRRRGKGIKGRGTCMSTEVAIGRGRATTSGGTPTTSDQHAHSAPMDHEDHSVVATINNPLHPSHVPSTEGSSSMLANTTSGNGSTNSRLLIRPNGNEFFPPEAVKLVSAVVKSKYDQPWLGWNEIPRNVKNLWYTEFKRRCRWDSEHDLQIERIWNRKCAPSVRSSLSDIRRGKAAGRWMSDRVLQELKRKWDTNPNFKEISKQNKKNIAANTDGCLNRSGAISISEHMRRIGLELKLGRDATVPEVFLKLNYDENTDKWVNPRAASAYDAYRRLKSTKEEQGETDFDESTLFYEANGGKNKRGSVYGFGSEIAFFKSSSSTSKVVTQHNIMDQQVYDRLSAMESELASLRSQLEKHLPQCTTSESSSRVAPTTSDNVELSNDGNDY